jgi:hypothetical protein
MAPSTSLREAFATMPSQSQGIPAYFLKWQTLVLFE